ncbi:MAG TPA: hypothetical protein VFG34_10390 [Sphingopyxis sp.]|nr:hypothetical protein [Sphingopyxis sp.]
MKIITRPMLIGAAVLMVAGCSKKDSSDTAATLEEVAVQPGTISDDMILLDQAASDGTAIDTSLPKNEGRTTAAEPTPTPDEAPAATAPADAAANNANPASNPAPAAPAPSAGPPAKAKTSGE